MPKPEIVWLEDEGIPAIVIRRGAFVSLVRYTRGGIDYEILVENDEFIDDKGGDDDEN